MIEKYITNDWQTMKSLKRKYLGDNIKKATRHIRHDIESFNDDYFNGDSKKMIVYSSLGYKLTEDTSEIEKCMNLHLKQAVIHFKKYHKIAKTRGFKINMNIEELLND